MNCNVGDTNLGLLILLVADPCYWRPLYWLYLFITKYSMLYLYMGQWKIVFQFLPNNINTICVPYYKTMELPFVEQSFQHIHKEILFFIYNINVIYDFGCLRSSVFRTITEPM